MQLENKVAIVTGSSSGIGKTIAQTFAEEGAAVTVNYRSHPKSAEEVVQKITDSGGEAISVQADISKPEDVKNLVERTVEEDPRSPRLGAPSRPGA